MIHIGYGDSATGCIKEAMKAHDLPGENAIPSRDDYTQGAISKCFDRDGVRQRIEYWQMISADVPMDMDIEEFSMKSIALLDDVRDTEVTLWQGDSCHDILATAWLLTYLKDRNINWKIIDLGLLSPEELNEGLPPVNLAMFSPEQVAALYKYKQSINEEVIEIYQDLWQKVCAENSQYRIKLNNEIVSVAEDYHDEYILSIISEEWEEAPKTIGKIISQANHTITDTTTEWRIRKLIQHNRIAYDGTLDSMNNYRLKKLIH